MEHSYSNIWFCNWGGFLSCPSDAVSAQTPWHCTLITLPPPCSHVMGLPEEWMSGWPHASWLLLYSVGLKVRWRRKTCSRLCCGPQAYCCWRLLQESTYCKCQLWSDAAQRVWKPGPSMLFPEKVLVHHQHTAVESTAPSRAFTAHWGRKAYSFSPQGMIIAWSVVWFSES